MEWLALNLPDAFNLEDRQVKSNGGEEGQHYIEGDYRVLLGQEGLSARSMRCKCTIFA